MWYNGIIKWLLRSPLHAFISGNIALISYNGRHTNKPYSVPVSYIRFYDQEGEEESGRLAMISFRKRTWWRNLRGGRPDPDELAQAAAKRVIIHLFPTTNNE
jgi:hypothetical protein